MAATLDTTLDQAVRRRDLLKHGFIWGGLGAAAATVELATPERAAGAPAGGTRVGYDVASLDNTLRVILAPGADTEAQSPVRAVIGGTGRFSGARDTVTQHGNAELPFRVPPALSDELRRPGP